MPKIKLQVSPFGAELQSIAANGKEYLWQGCKEYWGRRAPILFPIVGRVADDTLRIDGKSYQMKQHGFARDAEFVPNKINAFFSLGDSVQIDSEDDVFGYTMSQGEFANYPYRFELKANYIVAEQSIICNWQVQNCDDKDMYFQIGAHPAFLLPDYSEADEIHGYLQCLDENGKVVNPMTNSCLKDGLRRSLPLLERLYDCDNSLAITNDSFAKDAILIEDKQV